MYVSGNHTCQPHITYSYVHYHTQPDCSLHLASQFSLSKYYVEPIYTKETTPGIIMASGTVTTRITFMLAYSCHVYFLCAGYCITSAFYALAGYTGASLVNTFYYRYYNLFVSNTSGASWVNVSGL